MKSLILASSSPRRKAMLRPHFKLRVHVPDIDEIQLKNESVTRYVRRIAYLKWSRVASRFRHSKHCILAADTIVVLKKRLLGKPASEAAALAMLRSLSGQKHHVITAVSLGLAQQRPQIFSVKTRVEFRRLKPFEIKAFVRSGQWKGKAGAYGIQGGALTFSSRIVGSLTSVVGLPLSEVLDAVSHLKKAKNS